MEKPARDPRLDFFRGAALFIIFIAHARGTYLWEWIPARFGLSDAAHLFVFCSGYAAAIAFGGTFDRHGFGAGTARIGLRCAQLFTVHVSLFLLLAALAVAASTPELDYAALLGLDGFFAAPQRALLGLLTLSYVPPYLDILPLYMLVLAMVPAAMLLARLHPLAPPAASVALYAAAWAWDLNLVADAATGRAWFFDPLAWQLVFFTGFSLKRGWLEPPGASRLLFAACAGFILVAFLITRPSIYGTVEPLSELRDWVLAHSDKTRLDLLAYAHFLATAYVAVQLLKGREHVLLGRLTKPVFTCGQQALSVFAAGIVLSQLAGLAFDLLGTGILAQVMVNAGGFLALVATSYTVAWFKAPPWKQRAVAPASLRPALLETIAIPPPPRPVPIGSASAP